MRVSVCLIVSSKVSQNVFIQLFYNTALCFASCCSYILHVIAILIYIFVSRQMVLISTLPKFLHFLWTRRVRPNVLLKNLISSDVNLFHPLLKVQISPPFKIMERAYVFYTFILQNVWICTQWAFLLSCVQTWKHKMHYSVFSLSMN